MAKTKDINGFEEYTDTLISREGVFQYSGQQIDPTGRLGLDRKRLYNVYRPASEVCSDAFVKSLQQMPLVNDHTIIGEGATPPEKKGVDGVLYDVHPDESSPNVLRGTIKVFSEKMKSDIRNGKRELSLGYMCKYRREMGVFEGKAYDFVQSGLVANHIALVDAARMGSDCRVMDCMCTDSLELTMPDDKNKDTKSCVDEILEKLNGCSDEDRAKILDALKPKDDSAKDENKDKGDEGKKDDDKGDEDKDKEPEPAKDKCADKDEDKKDDGEKDKKEPAADAAELVKSVAKEYGAASRLFERCRSVIGDSIMGNATMDGLYTQKDVAVKACELYGIKVAACDALPTINGVLAGLEKSGKSGAQNKVVVTDSKTTVVGSFDIVTAYLNAK